MGSIYPSGVVASASFLPTAAAYSAGNIIDVAKELIFQDKDGRVVTPGALIRVMSTVIKIDQTALLAGETGYSLALYSVTPPSAQANNAAWTLASGDLPAYRGTLGLGTPVDLGSACFVKTQLADQQDVLLASGKSSLFGQLITAGGVTFTAIARQLLIFGIVL